MPGGFFGGALWPTRAGEHYFQADLARNHANIQTLLRRPIQSLHLGHGGPVTRESVIEAFGKVQAASAPAGARAGPVSIVGDPR